MWRLVGAGLGIGAHRVACWGGERGRSDTGWLLIGVGKVLGATRGWFCRGGERVRNETGWLFIDA